MKYYDVTNSVNPIKFNLKNQQGSKFQIYFHMWRWLVCL